MWVIHTIFALYPSHNIKKIDHNVRPDSMLVLLAAQDVVGEEGFEELLENVRDRIDVIESLHRTRELTVWFRFMAFFPSFLSPLLPPVQGRGQRGSDQIVCRQRRWKDSLTVPYLFLYVYTLHILCISRSLVDTQSQVAPFRVRRSFQKWSTLLVLQ